MKSILAVIAACLLSNAAYAQRGDWSEKLVCSAGMYNYFYLKKAPVYVGETGSWLVFRSPSGATYDCQLQGQVIAFKWKNDQGPMSSKSTRFDVKGTTLTVYGDMSTAKFRRNGDGWSALE